MALLDMDIAIIHSGKSFLVIPGSVPEKNKSQ